MTQLEKLTEIADILDMDESELTMDCVLDEVETWDSVAVLSFISVMNDKFDKFPDGKEIRQYKTIGDLVDAMC